MKNFYELRRHQEDSSNSDIELCKFAANGSDVGSSLRGCLSLCMAAEKTSQLAPGDAGNIISSWAGGNWESNLDPMFRPDEA